MPKKSKTAAPRNRRKPSASANITEVVLSKAEIAERLERATKPDGRFSRDAAVALAEANGFRLNLELDNGRVAMNTRNVLRARALKGERVVWAA